MLQNAKAQYFLLGTFVIVGLGIGAALLESSSGPIHSPIFYQARSFVLARQDKLPLNPILDVKNFLLSRYPDSSRHAGNESINQSNANTQKYKEQIYGAFMAHDFSALRSIFKQLSFEARPDNVAYSFYGGITRVSYVDFDVHEIVDALDTTVLLTAYLFERMGLKSSARKYYAIYDEALKLILLPGLDSPWTQMSRRLSVAQMKLNFILQGDAPLPNQYNEVSYTDTLVEMFLEQTLADPAFARYRKAKLTYLPAAQKVFYGYYSTTQFDPEPIKAAIARAPPADKAVLTFEYCLFNAKDEEPAAICSPENIETLFGKKSYPTAILKYKLLSAFVKKVPAVRPKDRETSANADDTSVRHDKDEDRVKSDIATFNAMLASLEASFEDRTYNLRDDTLYLSYRFFDAVGQADAALEKLCLIISSRTPGSDHALLASAKLKEKGLVCRG